MDNNSNNASLLGFLQKKSLFSNSPNNRSRNRSRSGSKDGRFYGNKSNVYQLDDRSEGPSERAGNLRFNYNEDNIRNYQTNPPRVGVAPPENNTMRNPISSDNQRRFEPYSGENKMFQQNSPSNDFRSDVAQYQSTAPNNDYRNYQTPPSPISNIMGNQYE